MTGRKAVGILAAAVLGITTIVSVARATGPCGFRACLEDIAAACGGSVNGPGYGQCVGKVLRNCAQTTCTCTGGGTPCGSPSGAFLD